MSSAREDLRKVNVQDLVDRMNERPAGWLYGLAVLLVLIGVAGFLGGLATNPDRAWTALAWNWVFFTGISLGGGIVVAATTAASGQWIRTLRRFSESLTSFLPVSFVLMIVLFFGLGHVYDWTHHPIPEKAAWLNAPFFVVREAVIGAVLFGFVLALVYWSLRPDVGRLRERVDGWRRGLYDRMTGGWRGLEAELERSRAVRGRLAPAVIVLYAVLWSIAAWDWVMSIDPHWFSTLFAAWIFMTHFLSGLSATALLAVALRRWRTFPEIVDRRSLHDIGKMVFAFTVFWTYLFFSQYLVIWYGRLPEETGYVKLRLWHAYEPIAIAVLLGVFLIPFLGLLGARPKKTPVTLATFSTVSLVGIWLLHFLLVAPSPFPNAIAFGWIELAVAVGLAGAFLLCLVGFLSAFPTLAIAAGIPLDEEVQDLVDVQED